MTLHFHNSGGPQFHPGLLPSGLGATSPTPQQLTAVAGQSASAAVTIAVALGVVSGPVGAIAAGAIALAATLATAIEGLFSGCGQTCVQATAIANQVGNVLAQNVDNYVSQPVRYKSMQAAALSVFDQAWAQLVQACNNPALGAAGQRCITDRQQGSCAYHASPGGWTMNPDGTCTWTPWGANGSGSACWNWFVGQRDPIANDPCVQPDPVSSSSSGAASPASGSGAGFPVPLLFIGAGLLILAVAR